MSRQGGCEEVCETVIACSMIARHGVSALVLVDRKTLARHLDVAGPTAGYGLVVVDECHHVPAAVFEHAVKQIPARRWLGLTATPYRRDKLDDLIALQLGPVRHTIGPADDQRLSQGGTSAPQLDLEPRQGDRPTPVLHVHTTTFRYTGDADPSAPGGIAAVYRDLVADDDRTQQVVADVTDTLARGRHCLVLTQWTTRASPLSSSVGAWARRSGRRPWNGSNPPMTALRCWAWRPARMSARASTATLFLAAPIAFRGRLVQ